MIYSEVVTRTRKHEQLVEVVTRMREISQRFESLATSQMDLSYDDKKTCAPETLKLQIKLATLSKQQKEKQPVHD